MTPATTAQTPFRYTLSMLSSIALVALAWFCVQSLVRRRPPGLAWTQLPAIPSNEPQAEAEIVDAVVLDDTAVVEPEPSSPSFEVTRFEAVNAGESVLFRVHLDPVPETADVVLIVDHGEAIDLLRAMPNPLARGAFGFAAAGSSVGATMFWLQVGNELVQLGRPAKHRVAAGV